MKESWLNPINNDLYSTGKANLFEFLTKTIVFSHVSNRDKIRCLYLLLKNMDMNNNGNLVKESHMMFLIWYLLRTALIYTPYDEVCVKVERLKHGMSGGILRGKIINHDTDHAFDVTEMLTTWLTAVRKYSHTNILELGKNGDLIGLRTALKHWFKENKIRMPPLGSTNELVVYYTNEKSTKKFSLSFDSAYSVKTPKSLPNQSLHCIVVQDTDTLISYAQFSEVSLAQNL